MAASAAAPRPQRTGLGLTRATLLFPNDIISERHREVPSESPVLREVEEKVLGHLPATLDYASELFVEGREFHKRIDSHGIIDMDRTRSRPMLCTTAASGFRRSAGSENARGACRSKSCSAERNVA